MTAHYNAPDRRSDLEASFHSLAEAQAYADEYGGEVEGRGVAFVVGPDADHERAQDDFAALAKAVPAEAPSVTSDIDERVNRAIEARLAELGAAAASRPEPVVPDPGLITTPDQTPDGSTPANPS